MKVGKGDAVLGKRSDDERLSHDPIFIGAIESIALKINTAIY